MRSIGPQKNKTCKKKTVLMFLFVVFISGNFTCNLDFLADIVVFTSNTE